MKFASSAPSAQRPPRAHRTLPPSLSQRHTMDRLGITFLHGVYRWGTAEYRHWADAVNSVRRQQRQVIAA